MSSITDLIRKEIENLSTDATRTNVGTIITLADGVAKVDGLSKVMFNEMIEFPNNVLGIALNLEEDSVGCVLLGDVSSLKEGDEARTTGKLLSVPVGKELLGRVDDAVGRPMDGKGAINASQSLPVERIAPGIIPRKSVLSSTWRVVPAARSCSAAWRFSRAAAGFGGRYARRSSRETLFF